QSMGPTGSALDNAAAESFNSTLEWELLRNNHFHTREEARHAVAVWIDDYNVERRSLPRSLHDGPTARP
ncbi:integrase core domain-containing protein, partial [Mycobacterium canetti]|uniref:integrase core domain-containing protein n=1 Tax=Mycobacterium canetti TaxID=78331 RepID=UPI001E64559C